jgi:hypothetical protein
MLLQAEGGGRRRDVTGLTRHQLISAILTELERWRHPGG